MTSPISSDFTTKLKSPTAWRFRMLLGSTFAPRFFCCTDPNELGIVDGKEPVAIISASADVVTEGATIAFDGTDSYDPDGSIVGYSWSFGGGSPSSGTASTDNVTFASAGKKNIRLTVTDGTGKRSVPAVRQITVLDANDAFGNTSDNADEPATGAGVYVGTLTGVYYSEDSGQSWTALNAGLSGDALLVRDFTQDPVTYGAGTANRTLWVATDDGPYITTNGGGTWTQKLPGTVSNAWSDGTAPTVADLTFHAVQFAGAKLFTIARWTNGSGEERSWIFYTEDAGETWTEVTE